MLGDLGVRARRYEFNGTNIELAANRLLDNAPIVLLPLDILRRLPIAADWEDVKSAASHNEALRRRVNADIGDIWALKTRSDKGIIRQAAMQNRRSFDALLAMLEAAEKKPYDAARDPEGELFWRRHLSTLARSEPLALELGGTPDVRKAIAVVEAIIEQFKHLIENRRYSSDLYRDDGSPRPEKAAQRFFFAVSDCYCKANNLDVTPEADTGAGNVDFKFSTGYSCRILVEIKLSTNTRLISGFKNQITAYSTAEDAIACYYVVIDVGHLGTKDEVLTKLGSQWKGHQKRPQLRFVDGQTRPPASVR